VLEVARSLQRFPSKKPQVRQIWTSLLAPYITGNSLKNAFAPVVDQRPVEDTDALLDVCSSVDLEAEQRTVSSIEGLIAWKNHTLTRAVLLRLVPGQGHPRVTWRLPALTRLWQGPVASLADPPYKNGPPNFEGLRAYFFSYDPSLPADAARPEH
jgi:hypothetical protein